MKIFLVLVAVVLLSGLFVGGIALEAAGNCGLD